jgi:enoyl-CoA hydratase/carnithine racemase
MSTPINTQSRRDYINLQALTVRIEGAVLFAEIKAPPMNLLGPELIRDLVSLIQQAEADESVQVLVFKSADPDYFISHVDVTRIKENSRRRSWRVNRRSACSFDISARAALSASRRSRVAFAVSVANSCCRATCALPHANQRFSVSLHQLSM